MSKPHITEQARRDGRSLGRLRIEVEDGPDRGSSQETAGTEPIAVGAAPDNALRLRDPKVSRYHLELARRRDGVSAQDLGSLNGTWLGETRIHRATLTPGTRRIARMNILGDVWPDYR